MIAATRAVQRARGVRRGRVVLTAVMGEEYGGLGTKHLVKQGLRADRAIVGEPSELLPVIRNHG
jgi:acetylornithine deacetylase/succinyl-diaminopimelate desuccinylase-like protein